MAFRKFLEENVNAKVPVEHRAPSGAYTGEVQFIVDTDGNISDIQAITKHGFGIEDEIIRVMELSPKWISAIAKQKTGKSLS